MNKKIFEEIYKETYFGTLKFITIRCFNINDVNDILQDTYVEFYKILQKKKDLKIEKNQSYINGIASNVIKRYGAKKKNFVCLVNEENEEIDVADTFNLEQDFITKENAQKVFDYVKNKDLETGKIFYLYFIFGMKIAEIAEELNLNESNVKNKIYRTQKELQKHLRKDVIDNE